MSEVSEGVTGKNSEFTGVIESLGSNGEGIVHIGETVFFAPFTAVGEKVKLKALKVKNKIGYAKALEILTPADERVRARCPLFTKCGGCQLQHLRYGAQLKAKAKAVSDALRKIAGITAEVLPTVKSESQFEYRNKLQMPVGVDKDGNELTILDLIAEKEDGVLAKVENKLIKDKFIEVMEKCLSPREYKIICLRYGLKGGRPLTQRETAKLLKISRSYISRIEKCSVEKIKETVKKEKIEV